MTFIIFIVSAIITAFVGQFVKGIVEQVLA